MADDLHTRLLAELHAERYDSPTEIRLSATLGAVVKQHAPETLLGMTTCKGCYEEPLWPCSTIRTIAEQLGLTEGERS